MAMKKQVETTKEPEEEIMKLAKSGALFSIGQRAIKKTHKLGKPAVIVENGNIIRFYPDGSKEIIGKAARGSGKKYTTGKWKIK